MKIIIDISENLYNFVNTKRPNGYYNNFDEFDCYDVSECIRKGIPLPKEHGDLIDRNQILQKEHFVILGDVKVGDKNFGEQEIDMFPKQTIMSVKPVIKADKEK